ncbi:hypothetical protein G6F22_019827 [Rhizopus arrhizus]|nr:hypothetical protein G6F22_019827 [Rhizopus arrhizus]
MVGGCAAGRCADQHIAPFGQRQQAVEVLVGRTGLGVAVVVADRHAERAGARGQLFADGAHAEDAQPLARDIGRRRDRRAPHPVAAKLVQLAEIAHAGNHQAHRMVGHALVVGAAAIGDDDSACAGGIHVHGLVADTHA